MSEQPNIEGTRRLEPPSDHTSAGVVIEYSPDGGGTWRHGRTLPAWIADPAYKRALDQHRRIVRDLARDEHVDARRIITRVLGEDDPRAEVNRLSERPAEATVLVRRWPSYAGRPLERRLHWVYGCTGPDGRDFQHRQYGTLLMDLRRAYPGVAVYAVEAWKNNREPTANEEDEK